MLFCCRFFFKINLAVTKVNSEIASKCRTPSLFGSRSGLMFPDADPENFVSGLLGEGGPSPPTKSLAFLVCVLYYLQRGSNCLIQRKLKNFQGWGVHFSKADGLS